MKNPSINADEIADGGVLTTLAFGQVPYIGPFILVVGIICFAFSTILGWAYYGERCVEYVAGKKALIPYRLLYVIVALVAPVVAAGCNGLLFFCGTSIIFYNTNRPLCHMISTSKQSKTPVR